MLEIQGRYRAAEQMDQQALQLRQKVLGLEHPHTPTSMNNLAAAVSGQGKYVEAEQTLEFRKKVL